MSDLKLLYAFLPSRGNPVVASPEDGDPVVIDLVVMASNPDRTETVTLEQIQITIPVGSSAAGALSSQPDLPAPVYDSHCGWTITAAGSTVKLSPPAGAKTAQVAGSVVFKLKGVQINAVPGTVQLKVFEQPGGGWAKDPTTYTLVKVPSDCVIEDFHAKPSALYDIEQPVTLYWSTTDAGEHLGYQVQSDNDRWKPKDCLNGGTCYQRSDGRSGVSVPPAQLVGTTVFTLLACATDGQTGDKQIVAKANATVLVTTPAIARNSRLERSQSGSLLALHWRATDAGSAQVLLDGLTVDAAAPVDTYLAPYSLPVTGPPGIHMAQLVALALPGPASAPFTFPEFRNQAGASIAVGQYPVAVATTSHTALVVAADGVAIVDLGGRTVRHTVTVGQEPTAIAITPAGADGAAPLAFVTNSADGTVTVIDVAAGVARPQPIQVGGSPNTVTFTPDGTLALVGNWDDSDVTIIDVAKMTAEAKRIKVGLRPSSIAVTPDGRTAFVADSSRPVVAAIDIATRSARPALIALQGPAGALAVPRDGSALLATDAKANAVTVIDLPPRSPRLAAIAVGHRPSAIALTPDGSYALVTNSADGTISALQVATRSVLPGTIAAGRQPVALAIAPDGLSAVVANYEDGAVTLL